MESPRARSSSSASRGSNLTLDLSSIPPLVQPTPPSNTLLLTNLNNPTVFRPENLETIRHLISSIAPIHAFAPLKTFRRIVISFFTVDAAIAVRSAWDGTAATTMSVDDRVRVYFGQHTPVEARDEHLALPDAGRLFFISPPPSPPHGWEMRMEDAPNKQVHADDLADALAKLNHASRPEDAAMAISGLESPISPVERSLSGISAGSGCPGRSRSSTLIYRPGEHGSSPALPAVFVEDMTDEPEELVMEEPKPIPAHTARPPVELMSA